MNNNLLIFFAEIVFKHFQKIFILKQLSSPLTNKKTPNSVSCI